MKAKTNLVARVLRGTDADDRVRLRIRLGLAGCILALFGCTATYMGGASTSPDGRYTVFGKVRGAYGRAFPDYSVKELTVTINDVPSSGGRVGEKRLFQQQYEVVGSDVGWEAVWDKDNNLTILVFDYGRNTNRWEGRRNGIPKRNLQTLRYQLDSRDGGYRRVTTTN